MEAKRIAAEKAVDKINSGMVVGLGSGSTSFFAIQRIGQLVSEGLKIEAVASSMKSEALARQLNIPILPFEKLKAIDIAIDGADEVDKNKNLIKGGGGSLLREKIIAFHSKAFYVIVDESKLVKSLGKFPLPVEIIPFAFELTVRQLKQLNCLPSIRQKNNEYFITDNGNLIADCEFDVIKEPSLLHAQIKSIPGVVETGLFMGSMVTAVIAGYQDGKVETF